MSYLPTQTVYNTTPPALTNGQQAQIQSDSAGSLLVSTENRKATYRASKLANPLANGWFSLFGSATKLVKIKSIEVSQSGVGTAVKYDCQIIKYSTAPTGGTSSAVTATPLDSTDAASTVTNLNAYSAAPTYGTQIGQVAGFTGIVGSPAVTPTYFVTNFSKLTLRGTGEGVFIFFNAVNGTSPTATVTVEWTEE